MEFNFEQLYVVLLIILFSLADLFMRWVRRKYRQATPEEVEQEAVPIEQQAPSIEEEAASIEGMSSIEEGVASIEVEEPARTRPLPTRPPVATPPPPAPSPSPRARRTGAGRGTRWLAPGDARRGIVLMTVLGPCRGLE